MFESLEDFIQRVNNGNRMAVAECWLNKANQEVLRQLDREGKIL